MPDTSTLLLFSAAAIALFVTPGPAILYIVARSMHQGRRAGLVSTLGITTGTLVHIAAAALGLSAIIAASAAAFNIVRYSGAAYLIYLGVTTLLSKRSSTLGAFETPQSLWRIYWQGVAVNVLNPKTAIFFLAFFPQFIDPARGAVAGQVIVFGAVFVTLGLLNDGSWALAAGAAGRWLRGHVGFDRAARYFSGGVYLALGAATALSGARGTR